MREKDVVSREYFKDPLRFADLINGFVYQGKQVVQPQDVHELGETIPRLDFRENHAELKDKPNRPAKKKMQAMFVDIAREISRGVCVEVVLLENQSDIHYIMPVRVMNEESAYYQREWRQIAKSHKQKKDLQGAEYLSGFSKTDKLKPVITIVVYWGKKPWDGPRCLKDVLDLEDCSLEMQQLIVDYPMHLLEVRKFERPEDFKTDIRYVFGFLQRESNKKRLASYVEENADVFSGLTEDAYDMIHVMSNTKELDMNKQENKEGGGYNMCKAIYDMVEDGRREGREERSKLWTMLITKMNENGMLEDIPRLAVDDAFFEKMVQKYIVD